MLIRTLILFVLMFTLISAQEETLIKTGKIESGGYGAVTMKFGQLGDDFALFMGGYGGWLINHKFMIGGGGYGLVNKIPAPTDIGLDPEKDYHYQIGYGGFMMEYIGNPMKLIHYNVKTLIGAGGAGYQLQNSYDIQDTKETAFFVLEVDGGVEVNVVEYMRICFGAGYRFVSGIDLEGLKDEDLTNFNLNLTFKFGEF